MVILNSMNILKVIEDEIERVTQDCEEEWMDLYKSRG